MIHFGLEAPYSKSISESCLRLSESEVYRWDTELARTNSTPPPWKHFSLAQKIKRFNAHMHRFPSYEYFFSYSANEKEPDGLTRTIYEIKPGGHDQDQDPLLLPFEILCPDVYTIRVRERKKESQNKCDGVSIWEYSNNIWRLITAE
jgi:hypothetical protein